MMTWEADYHKVFRNCPLDNSGSSAALSGTMSARATVILVIDWEDTSIFTRNQRVSQTTESLLRARPPRPVIYNVSFSKADF